MTGLEKILSQIEYEQDNRCRELISEAQAKAQAIIDEANEQAKQIELNAQQELELKLGTGRLAAESAAELAKSRALLETKLGLIEKTLESSLEVIKALPKKEYFEILKELILKNAQKGEGVLRLSANDTGRMPSNFIDSVNNAFKRGYRIKLGEEADIDSGFILVYGDIDVNCSFDAIAAAKRDELQDALNSLLFK